MDREHARALLNLIAELYMAASVPEEVEEAPVSNGIVKETVGSS